MLSLQVGYMHPVFLEQGKNIFLYGGIYLPWGGVMSS